jgi:hypothetical protein
MAAFCNATAMLPTRAWRIPAASADPACWRSVGATCAAASTISPRAALRPIATEALKRIAALYRIEDDIRGLSPDQRHAARQAQSRPLLSELHAWFETQVAKLPARSPTSDAIRYALNHWEGLVHCLEDGRIEVDTNNVERTLRPVALSRKNALFAGSDEGGANWAAVASLVETCKLNRVNPQRYLAELLTRLVNGWRQARIDELMPWCWAKTHPA